MMRTVCILDLETTGVDRENDQILEVGYVLWSVEHCTILEVYSGLLPAAANPAQEVNGIPQAALPVEPWDDVWEHVSGAIVRSDAVAAHQCDFDRAFVARVRPELAEARPWICTREDMRWPRNGTGESLIATALAHGVAVVSAHRAISDCLLIARLFEVVPDIAERLEAARVHALLPKVRLVSLAPFEEKETVKAHGFKWDPNRREWWRVMAVEDAKGLPFKTREVAL